ncbi:neo-calmodulin-like, partial [Ctenocephalides felis]
LELDHVSSEADSGQTADRKQNNTAGRENKKITGIDEDGKRHISKSQMREFREAFRLFDKDGDGCITKEELGSVMRRLGQFARMEELEEMLSEVDIDGDGSVSFEEFVEILSNMAANSPGFNKDEEEKELRDAFRVFDKHNRGYITASDLRAVLQCLGEDLREDEIEDMIKEVDVDGDGRIDFYEFVNALGEPEMSESQEDEEFDEEMYSEQNSPLPATTIATT